MQGAAAAEWAAMRMGGAAGEITAGREGFMEAFTKQIPRGLESRFLKTQRLPQARWQSFALVLESEALAYDPRNPGKKILVGGLHDKLIGIEDNRHILTVAGSRAANPPRRR